MPPTEPAPFRLLGAISEVEPAAWNALVDDLAAPFATFEFLDALERSGAVCAATGWHPRHLTVWEAGRLVAASPAYVKDHGQGEFVTDRAWAAAAERLGRSYYPKLWLGVPLTPSTGRRLLVAPGEDLPARRRQLLEASLTLAQAHALSSVHLAFALEEEVAAAEAAGFARRLGVQYVWRNEGYRGYGDFLARFTAKRRAQLRRERRAVANAGIQVRTLRGPELAALPLDELTRLFPRDPPSPEPALFARLLERCPDKLEWVEARRDRELLAGAVNFLGQGALFGRSFGARGAHPFLHFAVCLYHPVEECIARGLSRFEPGAGGEHKLARGFAPTLTHSAHAFFHPKLEQAVREFLRHEEEATLNGLPALRAEMGFRLASSGGAIK